MKHPKESIMQVKYLTYFTLFFVLLVVGGCSLFENEQKRDTKSDIFGLWELQEIRYDNGEILTPKPDEPYWFELKEDSILAEGEYHPSLVGQSNCNSCFGYFDHSEETQEIQIAFICNRLVCGIASTFSLTVAASRTYSLKNGKLLLFFDSIPNFMSAGTVILKLKK